MTRGAAAPLRELLPTSGVYNLTYDDAARAAPGWHAMCSASGAAAGTPPLVRRLVRHSGNQRGPKHEPGALEAPVESSPVDSLDLARLGSRVLIESERRAAKARLRALASETPAAFRRRGGGES
jgi:hypothetical protein